MGAQPLHRKSRNTGGSRPLRMEAFCEEHPYLNKDIGSKVLTRQAEFKKTLLYLQQPAARCSRETHVKTVWNMKTQISNLINGSFEVRRNEEAPKYINAPRSTAHTGYAGSSYEERKKTADAVLTENPDGMDVEMFGSRYHLAREQSISGKTVCYKAEIRLDDFMLLSGYALPPFGKHQGRYYLKIDENMKVSIQKLSRRNDMAQWKYRGEDYVGEEFVTIL